MTRNEAESVPYTEPNELYALGRIEELLLENSDYLHYFGRVDSVIPTSDTDRHYSNLYVSPITPIYDIGGLSSALKTIPVAGFKVSHEKPAYDAEGDLSVPERGIDCLEKLIVSDNESIYTVYDYSSISKSPKIKRNRYPGGSGRKEVRRDIILQMFPSEYVAQAAYFYGQFKERMRPKLTNHSGSPRIRGLEGLAQGFVLKDDWKSLLEGGRPYNEALELVNVITSAWRALNR